MQMPPESVTPWHPPNEPNPNTNVNGRRLEAAARHRAPSGVALAPFAQLPTIHLPPVSAGNHNSGRISRRTGVSNRRTAYKYLVVLHPEPVCTFHFHLSSLSDPLKAIRLSIYRK
jgi:hypothetical protein